MESNASPDLVANYRRLRKDGALNEALRLARKAVPTLEPGQVAQLGKLLQKDLPASAGLAGDGDATAVEVLLLGQCTTTYLPPAVTAWAWSEGLRVSVKDGEYDQVLQELMQLTSDQAPAVIVVLPWNQRLLGGGDRGVVERVDDELAFLKQVWAQVVRLKAKLVQVSYDWVHPGPLGYSLSSRRGGTVELVQRTNAALRAALPAGAYYVDLETVSAWRGKAEFYDERNYHWLKQPFSPAGLSLVGRHLATGVRALTSGRRKVLVLDLDNTLWGGVVGENGPHGIAVGGTGEGQAFTAFQKYAKRLKDSGVILAVSSKNNDADAREPFEKNEEMVLKLTDFASFHASWDPKPSRLRLMAKELNLGLDSFVFFDDNPVERERMRAELPEVTVVEAPVDPDLYIRALQESLAFEAVDVTSADAERTAQYQAESSRRASQESAASPEDYLASLNMKAEAQPVTEANLDRVVDLITKTNQFNLTTRRHSRAAVEEMVAASGSVAFAVSLADKFGDYGLIAVVLGTKGSGDENALRLDTWLMSCRAMGRTVEHWTLNHLTHLARELGYDAVNGEYLPTAKNVPVQTLLADFGFVPRKGRAGESMLKLSSYSDLPTQVF
jgi:FkbH-like protein